MCLLISQILTRKHKKTKNHHLVTAFVTYNSGKIENPQPTYLNTPFIAPFSWTCSFWWRGELGVEQHFDILAAILFSIMIDLIVIFLVGLLYLSSHGSHCRKTRLLWNRKKNYYYRVIAVPDCSRIWTIFISKDYGLSNIVKVMDRFALQPSGYFCSATNNVLGET